jgi:predicted HNH restriction endonuclease
MDRKEDREILRKGGFAEGEMKRLSQLRKEHHEKERLQAIAEHRRLEFVRWLVTTGKLSEQIAS